MLGDNLRFLALFPALLGAWWLWRGGLSIYGGLRFLWAPRGVGKAIAHYRTRRVKKDVRFITEHETIRIPFLTTAFYTYTVDGKTYVLRHKVYGFGKTAERPNYLATVYYIPRFPYIAYIDAIGASDASDILFHGFLRLVGALVCLFAAVVLAII